MREALFSIVLAAALDCAAATATGFFHFENRDGGDWAVTPDGRAVTLAGVDFVNPHVFHSTFLGYAPYARFVETNYPSLGAWADETAERLRSWGFNMLASHCETSLFPGFPHADTLNLNNPFAKSKDPEWRIAENTARKGYALGGEKYKRPKKDFGDEVLNDWCNRKWLMTEKSFDHGGAAYTPALPQLVADAFGELMPLYEYLLEVYLSCPEEDRER